MEARHSKHGFTLVEVMIATILFILMSLGVARMTMLSFRTAYVNVYKTTAESVAQGYLEQIKSMDNESLFRAATIQATAPLQARHALTTRSVSLLATGATIDQIDDWLVPNALDQDTLSDTLQVINHKRVLVDVDSETGQQKTMDMWFDVEIHRVPDMPGNVYLIDLQYAFSLPILQGTATQQNAWTRTSSRNYSLQNQSLILRDGVNTGRMQLITSLLNFDSL